MRVAGLLLAGGASRRFGAEKAVALGSDGFLMDVPRRALIEASDAVAVSARPDSGAARLAVLRGHAVLNDPPDVAAGPLAGLLAGLEWARGAEYLLTAPCDVAALSGDRLRDLLVKARETGRPAMAASASGLQPLVAAWPAALSLEAVRGALQGGDHPPVRAVLAALGAVALEGVELINHNSPADLPANGESPDHARLFQFEDDFVRSLRCIPMSVRFKLDRARIKLSLRQWSRFSLADRDHLRLAPCESAAEVVAYGALLEDLVRVRTAEQPTPLATPPASEWLASEPPELVAALAEARRVAVPTDLEWRALRELERYALVKLTRDRHENANFVPALREFGLA